MKTQPWREAKIINPRETDESLFTKTVRIGRGWLFSIKPRLKMATLV